MNPRKTVYYAHCIALYGTEQERRDVELLELLGFQVYNPNNPNCAEGYKQHGMEFFEDLVPKFEVLAFRALPDASIPAGVYGEIRIAQDAGMPIIELPSAIQRRSLSVTETREYLSEVGYR